MNTPFLRRPLLLAGCWLLLSGGAAAAGRPNILFIMSDDHATSAVSAYGQSWLTEVAKTPHIDRLAREGMRFDRCLVVNSICTPSRAAILTGQYSHRNGVYTLNDALDPARPHVAKLLRAAGYQTAMIGKWHLASEPAGFDYWNVLPGQGRYHDPVLLECQPGGGGPARRHVVKGHTEDVIAETALRWLGQRDPAKPFLLFCHFKAPHRSWEPAARFARLYEGVKIPEPPTLLDTFQNRSRSAAQATLKIGQDMTRADLKVDKPPSATSEELRRWAYQIYAKDYLRCVAGVDENVGRLLKFLDDQRLAVDTLVVYTSDQGFFVGEHGYYDKRFMYEPSLRSPLLVRWPGRIRPGSANRDMALNIDFAETMLDVAGLPIPRDMQGRSLRPLLEGRTPADWRKSMYYRYWMHLADHGVPAHYGVATDRFKLIYYYGQALGTRGSIDRPTEPEWELFDLANDPQELRNVYADPAYASAVVELKAELARLRKEVGDER